MQLEEEVDLAVSRIGQTAFAASWQRPPCQDNAQPPLEFKVVCGVDEA